MDTLKPGARAENSWTYPYYVCWELRYPNSVVSYGACLVVNAETAKALQSILEYEAAHAELSPVLLVQEGQLTRCPEHGRYGDYQFCPECGKSTRSVEPMASGWPTTERCCSEHGICGDSYFCGHCGQRTMLVGIKTG
jgi:hypothetical protein